MNKTGYVNMDGNHHEVDLELCGVRVEQWEEALHNRTAQVERMQVIVVDETHEMSEAPCLASYAHFKSQLKSQHGFLFFVPADPCRPAGIVQNPAVEIVRGYGPTDWA